MIYINSIILVDKLFTFLKWSFFTPSTVLTLLLAIIHKTTIIILYSSAKTDRAAALVLFPTILLVLYISTSNVVNSGPPPKIKIIENEVKQYRNIKRNDDIREGNILTRVIEKKVLSLDAPSSCDEYS